MSKVKPALSALGIIVLLLAGIVPAFSQDSLLAAAKRAPKRAVVAAS